jgi:hypothetical protein
MRNKTELRYVDRKTGKVTRVTEEGGKYLLGIPMKEQKVA